MYQLSQEVKESINRTLLQEIGMTYDEFEKLDWDIQQEILQKNREKKKKDEKEALVMIGSGEHAIFVRVPKGKKVMLEDGTIIRAGVSLEESMEEFERKMNKQDSFQSPKLLQKIKRKWRKK